MFHLEDSLNLDVVLGGSTVPTGLLDFQRIFIQSDSRFFVPMFSLEFGDVTGVMRNKLAPTDAMPIQISIGRNRKDQVVYQFMIFSVKETPSAAAKKYMLTGYLAKPNYLFKSSTKAWKGSSSSIIQQIAQQCSLTPDIDTTNDNQTWLQGNKRYAEFVRSLAKHGYISDTSVMVSGVTLDGRLRYKDWNGIGISSSVSYAPSIPTMTYFPASSSDIWIADHQFKDASGMANSVRGYKDLYVDQKLSAPSNHDSIQLRPRASQASVNTSLAGNVDRMRVDFSPAYHQDQVHDKYMRAYYQNARGAHLNSSRLEVLTPQQTLLDLFDPVNVSLAPQGKTPDGEIDAREGQYIVVGRQIQGVGNAYAERITLARAGQNR